MSQHLVNYNHLNSSLNLISIVQVFKLFPVKYFRTVRFWDRNIPDTNLITYYPTWWWCFNMSLTKFLASNDKFRFRWHECTPVSPFKQTDSITPKVLLCFFIPFVLIYNPISNNVRTLNFCVIEESRHSLVCCFILASSGLRPLIWLRTTSNWKNRISNNSLKFCSFSWGCVLLPVFHHTTPFDPASSFITSKKIQFYLMTRLSRKGTCGNGPVL